MSGQFTGMNIGEVRTLATQLDGAASDIEGIISRLTNQLNSTAWIGNDREQFVGEWQSAHTTALRNVATGLQDAAQKARVNADQQEQASA